MGVTSGIAHLFESVVEMIQGVFAAVFSTFKFALESVADLFKFAINSVMSLFSGFVNFVEGTLGFAFHNFFILGTLAAVVLGYMLYSQQQTQGRKGAIKN
ncbi:hypothetical protein F5Y08DRAFT_311129 [Xylaria arbuscula]|nr:hypothetical protein F5Y08DRAFT_311129 [Xylaria arbuscula]